MAQYDVNLREYWRILKKRKFTVLLIAIVLGAFSTFFAILRAPTPLYTSVCSIKFEKDTTVEGLYARTLTWSSGDDLQTQISLLRSYAVLQRVAEKLGKIPKGAIQEGKPMGPQVAAVVDNLQSKVQVSRESYTNIINISVTDPDPVFAQMLANTIALTYKDMHIQELNKQTKEALSYISEELRKVSTKLREAEDEFNRFTQKNQLVAIDLQSENLLLRVKEIKDRIRELEEAEAGLSVLAKKLKRFIDNPTGSGDDLYSPFANKQYQGAYDTLVELLLKRDSLLKDYTPKHPEVIALHRKIIESSKKMAITVQLQLEGIDKKKADLKQELGSVEKKTGDLMEKKLEYDRLKRKVASYDDMTALLERKSQEASIKEAEKPEEVTIVRPAFLPTSPINPPQTEATGAMGSIIGLILGMVVAFIAETFDTSLGAIEDVEKTLGTDVLGVIPHGEIKNILEKMQDKEGKEQRLSPFRRRMRLVSHFVPQSMVAESFRALRTNIQFHDVEKKLKTLAITSASPQEGKSIVATNLAITMAQSGMKTLLVESDLRKPRVANAFGIESTPGLTDVLLGNYSWRDVIKTITDIIVGKMDLNDVMATPGLDNLHILTSGTIPPNPSELIDSKRLVEFISEVKQEYDLVIFDTPPILSTTDPTILGTKVDAMLLVYRVGSVSKGLLKRSTVQLRQVKCNILGVVLNGMKAEVSPDFHDFKYYKSYYSYGKDGTKKKVKKAKTGVLAYFDKKRAKEKTPISRENPHGQDKHPGKALQKKKGSSLRLPLALIALGFLTIGVLWQLGIVPIDAYLYKARGLLGPTEQREPPRETKTIRPIKKVPTKPSAPEEKPAPLASKAPAPLKPAAEALSEKDSAPPSTRAAVPSTPPRQVLPEKKPTPPPEKKTAIAPAAEAETLKDTTTITQAPPINQPYSLRAGSYKTLAQVKEAVEALREKGLNPYWVKVNLGQKGTWFRVFVGHFSTMAEAKAFKEKHDVEADRVLKTAYTVELGRGSSPEKLTALMKRFKDPDYSPYILGDPKSGYRLLVGAFVTKRAAQNLARDFKEAGIDCKPASR